MSEKLNIKSGQLDSSTTCPQCSRTLDGFTSMSGHTPSAGDVTICVYCNSTLEFTEDDQGKLGLAPISPEVLEQVDFVQLGQTREFAEGFYQRLKKHGEL